MDGKGRRGWRVPPTACRKPVVLDTLSCTQLLLFCFPLSYILSHRLPKMMLPELSPSDAECSESRGRRVLRRPHQGGLRKSTLHHPLFPLAFVVSLWSI